MIDTNLGDVHQIITADGEYWTIPDRETVFQAYGNYGAPPIEFITRRGYKQHGVTFIDYLLSPRTVSVSLYRKQTCSRSRYWQHRNELHELLRPNRGGPITLVLRQASGAKRALKVWANPGAVFAGQDTNSWNIDEELELIAFDPIWYDPTTIDQAVLLTVDSSLIFPITFPITFGLSGAQFVYPITYTGTWQEYPTLILSGPYTTATIVNEATGVSLTMAQGCLEGDTRTIVLTPGSQSIVDAAGNNKFNDLAPDSDLVNFNIRPNPLVTDGIQTIRATLQGARVYTGTGWVVQSQIFAPNRWYRMDDTSTTLQDVGSDNAAGVISGTYTQGVASLVSGDTNTATTLDGSTALAVIPSCPIQNISYSVNLWANFVSIAGSPVVFGADVNAAALGGEFALGVTAAGALIIYLGGGTTFASANGLISTGTAYMLSASYNRVTGALLGLINGVTVISVTGSDFTASTPTCYIGSYITGNRTNGTIDEVQVWLGTALTQPNFALSYASRLITSREYTPSGFRIQYNNRYYAI